MTAPIYDIPVTRADGTATTLSDYAGKVLLVVNVASKCGFTKQYDGLEALYRSHRDRGFTVLGFPSNDFAGQEPGTDDEIQEFCRLTYGVDFPVFAKITVKGPEKHPLYRLLTEAEPQASFKPGSTLLARLTDSGRAPAPGEVSWNFEKFVIDADGAVVGRYGSDVTPEDEGMVGSIRKLLPS
ncbi:glutathione peroxidase [Mesorhizobium sp. LHD-90]|uniref:glutathione peroxidase n=1 Tax=Mesorhizobium sp. LHD-90 TaxID=3071414 RepID=UPI0027DFF679|nr:glutathione peroxidase [Mesorhizobium sp. LHD-90]MDQ6433352.1 glutathione peroxidase [Mesorhizobium sp. LHD-90]